MLLNNPRATVEIFKLLVNIKGVKNSTQDKINANMKAAIKPGLNKGKMMWIKSCRVEQPSIFAASSTSTGSLSINDFKIQITKGNVKAVYGTTRLKIVSSSWYETNITNKGITKSIVGRK